MDTKKKIYLTILGLGIFISKNMGYSLFSLALAIIFLIWLWLPSPEKESDETEV